MYEKITSKDVARFMVALVLACIAVGSFLYLVVRFGPNPMARKGQVSVLELIGFAGEPRKTSSPPEVAGARDKKRPPFLITELSAGAVVKGRPTVEYARVENTVLIRYDGSVYAPQRGFQPAKVGVANEELIPWRPLFSAPTGVGGVSEVFSYYASPDTNNLTIIMRWGGSSAGSRERYSVYTYNEADPRVKLRHIHDFSEERGVPSVPKTFSMNPSGRYVALSLHTCADCSGEVPETIVIDSHEGYARRLGRISAMTWLPGNEFQYKEYIEVECPDKTAAAKCAIDPSFIEYKTGKIH